MARSATKLCGACGKAKPLAAFHRRAASPDGLQGRCKDCESERVRTRSSNERSTDRARARALQELRRRHQAEFDEIFERERRRIRS